MIKFKGCPRCGGDLYLTEDVFGKYLSCFQCGFLRDLAERREEPSFVGRASGGRRAA